MISPALYSSATDDWSTPQDLFDRLSAKYGPFDLDVCATAENAKCKRFYSKLTNGLTMRWTGRVWCNPPYGKPIAAWVERAHFETLVFESGPDLTCMLLPARTDTKWFQDYVLPYAEVEFIRGRVKFGGHRNSAPFPSCVAVFRRSP